MNLSRYLTEELIKLEMETAIEEFAEGSSREKWLLKSKGQVLDELVALLDQGARIGNRTKLLLDFINREKKATTGIGMGVAIPHIRSLQAKEFMLAFARSTGGYEFDSLDAKPVHMFFVMASPPYDDGMYLRAFKSLASMLQYDSFREELMTVQSPGEVIRTLRQMEYSL
jgi:PTS system fructose-specific IIC component